MNVLHYDHVSKRCDLETLGISDGAAPEFAIYLPPIQERGYLNRFTLNSNDLVWYYTRFSVPREMTSLQLYEQLMGTGVSIQLMGTMDVQWESIQSR